MKALIMTFLLIVSSVSFSQQMSYDEWKTDAAVVIRMQPKYGNAKKTAKQNEADAKMIATYLEQQGTARKASDLLISLGFEYFYKADLKTAMSRFNQAWLLDPKNENVFRGFGAIYLNFKDYENAIKQYDEGLALNPVNSDLLSDKATVYMNRFQNLDQEDLNTAIKLFNRAVSNDPKNQTALLKLSACYLLKNDCDNAWKYYNACQQLGGKLITSSYTESLKQFCEKKN